MQVQALGWHLNALRSKATYRVLRSQTTWDWRFVLTSVQVPRSSSALPPPPPARPSPPAHRLSRISSFQSPLRRRAPSQVTMDLRGILNDDGNLPPATPKTGRQASVASMISHTPPSTAASYASKTSPAPQISPAPPPRARNAAARSSREIPPWARRFDWDALRRGEMKQAHIPERPPPPPPQQQLQQLQQGPPPPVLRQPSAPLPPPTAVLLEPSLTNVEPYDEVVRKVCDFLWNTVIEREDLHGGIPEGAHPNIKLEIEGKLGTLVDKNTNERVHFPVNTQAVSALPPSKLAFESFMNEVCHRKI